MPKRLVRRKFAVHGLTALFVIHGTDSEIWIFPENEFPIQQKNELSFRTLVDSIHRSKFSLFLVQKRLQKKVMFDGSVHIHTKAKFSERPKEMKFALQTGRSGRTIAKDSAVPEYTHAALER